MVSLLQSDLDAHLDQAHFLNIQLAPAKPDLLHLTPLTSNRPLTHALPPILLGPHPVLHSPAIKILRVWVDQQLSFSKHIYSAPAKLLQSAGRLKAITGAKDLSPGAIYHVASTTVIPAMLWGSSTWWNGTRAILNQLTPAYHSLAWAVCQAKSFNSKIALLRDSGFLPLDLLLDQAS